MFRVPSFLINSSNYYRMSDEASPGRNNWKFGQVILILKRELLEGSGVHFSAPLDCDYENISI